MVAYRSERLSKDPSFWCLKQCKKQVLVPIRPKSAMTFVNAAGSAFGWDEPENRSCTPSGGSSSKKYSAC